MPAKLELTPEEISALIEEVTAPGGLYEVTTETIQGDEYKVFAKGPRSLRDVYAYGLDHDAFISRAIDDWYGVQDFDFMVYQDERISFTDSYYQAAYLAQKLKEDYGLKPGDRVAIAMRNYPEFVLSFMAITAMGCVAVPLNAWWTSSELEYGLTFSGPKVIFADQERIDRLLPHLADLDMQIIAVRAQGELPEGTRQYTDIMKGFTGEPNEFPYDPPHIDDDAYLIYTSGSTGRPKAVVTTHRAVISAVGSWEMGAVAGLWNNREFLDEIRPENKSSVILTVPLFHVTGLVSQFLASFRTKRKMIMMYKWDPGEALKIIEEEKITQFNGVPTMSWELVNHPDFDKYDTSSVMVLGGGGAARPPEQVQGLEDKMDRPIAQAGYGMTETTALGTGNSGPDYLLHPDSVGKATPPLMEVMIADQKGQEVPFGEMGEICFKCASNMRCYLNNEEATAEIMIPGGWLRSGDLGIMDEDGFVYIKDRAKDLVIRGGENIACREVEDAIYEHPAVFEAAVFGLPESRLGEQVAAVIMTTNGESITEDEMREHLKGRIANYKIPSLYWFQKDSLQRGATGKIFKKAIREEKAEEIKMG